MKKLNIKSIFIGMIIGVMLSSSVFAETKSINAFYNNIKISLNGTILELKDTTDKVIEPFIYEGTTYLPIRAIAEALNMEVKFNETTNTVELSSVINAVSGNNSLAINAKTLEEAKKLPPEEKQKWLKEHADTDGNIIIDGKKVNIYTGLSENDELIDTINKTPNNILKTTSDNIELKFKYNNDGEYDKNGKYYVDTYQISQKYKNKFNIDKGFWFRVEQISEKEFKLVLQKNKKIILDNIPTLLNHSYNKIPLDYYENNILPLLK